MEGYGIYKNNIYGTNGQLIGKYTENTVFTKFGAWEMHKVDDSYYLRAVGATILGVPIGQSIQGDLLTIGTNAFLTIESNLIRCYDFAGNLVYDFNAIGAVQKPPLILNNTLITSSAAYNLANGTQIPGHTGGGIQDRLFVHEGKLYRWSSVIENNIRYYDVNHIDTGTGDIIKTVRTTKSLQGKWVGNINLGYYDAVNPTGRYIAQIVDLDTGACIGRTLIGSSLSYVSSSVLGNEIYVEIKTYFTDGVRVSWYRLEYDGENDQFKLQAVDKQKNFDKQYITHHETFTAHIEEEEPENPFSGITPNQVFIKSEEVEGQENTSYYKYPLSENVIFAIENLNITEILINNKSVNYNTDGDKVMVQADDINAALEEIEKPTFYEYSNKLIEKRNITIKFETDRGQKTAIVTQERIISNNIEEDVSNSHIIWDEEKDEPLYPDNPDYEEEKPRFLPREGEDPLELGDDGYPYDEDRGPIWSTHPDHPAFGIESISLNPETITTFPDQVETITLEINFKEGLQHNKKIEDFINLTYDDEFISLEIDDEERKLNVKGLKLTDSTKITAAVKGKFAGELKDKMTATAIVNVLSKIENIELSPITAEILHGKTQEFTVNIIWREGAEQEDLNEFIKFAWPRALAGEASGDKLTITGTTPTRGAKIIATLNHEIYGKFTAEAKLTVKQVIKSISITPKSANLTKGQTQEFNIEIEFEEDAEEKSLIDLCNISASRAISYEVDSNKITVTARQIAANARLTVNVKSEYLYQGSRMGTTAYIRITSFKDRIPNYSPLSALRLRFKAGSSPYELGTYLIDRSNFVIGDTTVDLECRNRVGHYLRDQNLGDNRNFLGPGSEVLEELLIASGVQSYIVQQDFTEEVHLELSARNTFYDAIMQVLELKPDWVIRQHRHDDIYPGNYEAILIGDANFLSHFQVYKGAYVFYRDRDIFSREVIRSVDDVYGRVCVHDKDFNLELYSMVENESTLMSYKTYFYEVPEGTTETQAQNILNRLVSMLKTAGKVETFVTAFRPHIEPGDLAYIKNQDNEEEVGIITSVNHTFGRRGFISEFTIDSSGLVEKESLLKMTMRRIKQEPTIRTRPSRHKITILGTKTQ